MGLGYNKKTKTLGPRAARLITTLYAESREIFRLKDVQKILGVDDPTARNFLRKLVGRGVVTRLKPGLFILVPFELGKEEEYAGNPLVLARELASGEDYYISHGTAMANAREIFIRKEARLKKLWATRLASQMAELPEFDQVHRRVLRGFRQAGFWGDI